ncbi:MAG: hypothetical protein N2049_05485 [Anaerolineales bacterium]|nr:hypothetical protein [Anaerolineales bacterium]
MTLEWLGKPEECPAVGLITNKANKTTNRSHKRSFIEPLLERKNNLSGMENAVETPSTYTLVTRPAKKLFAATPLDQRPTTLRHQHFPAVIYQEEIAQS